MSFTAREVAWDVHAYTVGTSRNPGIQGPSLAVSAAVDIDRPPGRDC